MKIKLMDNGYNNYAGFGMLTPEGRQTSYTDTCKEVFSHKFKAAKASKDGTIVFFRRDGQPKTAETAQNQEAVFHAFEKALGIEPLARVMVVENNYTRTRWVWKNGVGGNVSEPISEKLFVYIVSAGWKKSLPLTHLMALLARNYYPQDRRKDWRSILNWMAEKKILGAMIAKTAKEIINDGGDVFKIPNTGISSYASKLYKRRKEALAAMNELKLERFKNYAR